MVHSDTLISGARRVRDLFKSSSDFTELFFYLVLNFAFVSMNMTHFYFTHKILNSVPMGNSHLRKFASEFPQALPSFIPKLLMLLRKPIHVLHKENPLKHKNESYVSITNENTLLIPLLLTHQGRSK
jgi:hypothetical protein